MSWHKTPDAWTLLQTLLQQEAFDASHSMRREHCSPPSLVSHSPTAPHAYLSWFILNGHADGSSASIHLLVLPPRSYPETFELAHDALNPLGCFVSIPVFFHIVVVTLRTSPSLTYLPLCDLPARSYLLQPFLPPPSLPPSFSPSPVLPHQAFAMTGWRLGYVAAPRPLSSACNRIQSQTTSGPSSIAQKAAMAAFTLGPKGGQAVEDMVTAFRRRRDMVVGRLQGINGVGLKEPAGAFYVFPDVSSFYGKEAPRFGVIDGSDDMCRFLLEAAQVALVPGSAFGDDRCIRLSYAASDELLKQALDRIEKALATVVSS